MRFSIVTVTYNAEKYLEKTLKSVEEQDYLDYEHVLWDGGSTDKTLEIASRFPHVKIYQGKDGGISDAMNKGAALAKGDFLIHLHADDLLAHKNVLSLVDKSLKQHKAVWLYGQAHVIDAQGEKKKTTQFIPFDAGRLRKYNIITHPATVVSRSLFMEAGGFDPSLRFCMDYDFWLKLAQTTSAFALPAVLACFREHEGSLSTKEKSSVADEAYRVRNLYVKNVWERWKSYRTWKKRKADIFKKF